jgi:hypothetical protein
VFSNHIVDLLVAPRACCNHQGVRRRRCATSRAWRSPRSACSARHEKGRNVGRRVVENQRQQQGQRQRQRQVQRQPAASGPGATAVPVHGHRTRPPVTGSDTDEAISGNQERPWASFCGTPACRRVRRLLRLRSGSPPCDGVRPRRTRSISATSGRLDGLLGGCGALFRRAIPAGAPHGIVPIETRTLTAQYREPPARRCANSRAERGTRFSGPAMQETGRVGDVARLGTHGTRSQSFRRLRFGRRHVTRPSAMTGSATRVSENLRQGQGQGQGHVPTE